MQYYAHFNVIRSELEAVSGNTGFIHSVACCMEPLLPSAEADFVYACDELIRSHDWAAFCTALHLISCRPQVLKKDYFALYESWLMQENDSWCSCDMLCSRIINPILLDEPSLLDNAFLWALSPDPYVRRAALSCFIGQNEDCFLVELPFARLRSICDILMCDTHIHIRKCMGKVLKYAYLTYPDQVCDFLSSRRASLSRTAYRYAVSGIDPVDRMAFSLD